MAEEVATALVGLSTDSSQLSGKAIIDDDTITGVLVSAKMGNDMMKSTTFKDEDDICAKIKGDSKVKPKMKSVQCNHLRDKATITIWYTTNVEPTLNYIGSMLALKPMNGMVAITSDKPMEPKDIFDLVLSCNGVLQKAPKMGAALHGNKGFMAVSSVALNQILQLAGKPVPPSVGMIDGLLAEKAKAEQDLINQGGSKVNGKIIMGRGYDGPVTAKQTK